MRAAAALWKCWSNISFWLDSAILLSAPAGTGSRGLLKNRINSANEAAGTGEGRGAGGLPRLNCKQNTSYVAMPSDTVTTTSLSFAIFDFDIKQHDRKSWV